MAPVSVRRFGLARAGQPAGGSGLWPPPCRVAPCAGRVWGPVGAYAGQDGTVPAALAQRVPPCLGCRARESAQGNGVTGTRPGGGPGGPGGRSKPPPRRPLGAGRPRPALPCEGGQRRFQVFLLLAW